jgi:LEA14-like dessication related protein
MMLTGFLLLPSCRYARELSTLRKCEFRLSEVDKYVLAGIRMDEINSYSDLNFMQLGKITNSMAQGKLPLCFTINIEAMNPNPTPASLNKLEYIAFIDDIRIAEGAITERIDIDPSGGSAIIPIAVTTNLLDAFEKASLKALFNLVLNLMDAGKTPSRISLRIKPTISVAGKDIVYPSYIKIKTEFSSRE